MSVITSGAAVVAQTLSVVLKLAPLRQRAQQLDVTTPIERMCALDGDFVQTLFLSRHFQLRTFISGQTLQPMLLMSESNLQLHTVHVNNRIDRGLCVGIAIIILQISWSQTIIYHFF